MLPWETVTETLYTAGLERVAHHWHVRREDNLQPLGVVRAGFLPLRNAEAVALFDAFEDVHAGELNGGRWIWVAAPLANGESLFLANRTAGGKFISVARVPGRVTSDEEAARVWDHPVQWVNVRRGPGQLEQLAAELRGLAQASPAAI
jgi:hypothetical protein